MSTNFYNGGGCESELDNLANTLNESADAIEQLVEAIHKLESERKRLKDCCAQRGARMQTLHDAIIEAYSYEPDGPLHDVIARAAYWFDEDGVPK